jgi:N-acetylmuramoyl-L-alanine amidase
MTINEHDIAIMAKTIFGEARGEYYSIKGGLPSLIAIGNVIMNRYSKQSWYGKTIQEVCLKPHQFSCWNGNDVNSPLLNSIPNNQYAVYEKCYDVAQKIISNEWPDITKGADHYHATYVSPTWRNSKILTAHIGSHLFYY